ncbi:MAG: RNA polymerase sigma factor region1.1 domain-containing protein, partial [Candidatus Omnitrophota bacterium]
MGRKNKKRTKKNTGSRLNTLLVLGRKKGFLTYEEINNLLPEEIISTEQIEKVFTLLDNERIEVVDSEEEFKAHQKQTGGNGRHKKSDKERSGPSSSAADAGIEDPVKMYLRQMGQIPLLSREDEISLAKEIENKEEEYKKAVLGSPYIRDALLSLANSILAKKVNIEEVIKDATVAKKEEDALKPIERLVRKIRASKKGRSITELCLEFNFCISVIEDFAKEIRAAISEIDSIDREISRMRKRRI